ncbi:MAG: HAD family hydrolase, partial [Oscillospiraceae bacterium]|nr:HAD family hydrolase [Oscillospiraceae bacterium]
NQFNVTAKRYTESEMEAVSRDPKYVRLYGSLKDQFGDNGIVSVVIGRQEDAALHIELWLMSCRVLKRDMELAMLDRLVEEAQNRGIREIYGYYYPTAKNSMVKELFGTFGFSRIEEDEKGNTIWKLDCSEYTPKNQVISIKKESIV